MNSDALQHEWLKGWIGAAVEQEPALAAEAPEYLRRRSTASAVVHHVDLLAILRAV